MVYSTGIEKEIGALQLEVSIQALLYLYIFDSISDGWSK
jgi:hypothetical protein